MGGFWKIKLQWVTLPCISTNTTKVRNIYVCTYLQRVRIGFATIYIHICVCVSVCVCECVCVCYMCFWLVSRGKRY
jgi:hypothetical protein